MGNVTRLALVVAALAWVPLQAFADPAPACGNMASFDMKAAAAKKASEPQPKEKVAEKAATPAPSKPAETGKPAPSAQGKM